MHWLLKRKRLVELIAFLVLMVCGTVLCWAGRIDGGQWMTVALAGFGGLTGAATIQKVAPNRGSVTG